MWLAIASIPCVGIEKQKNVIAAFLVWESGSSHFFV
jgi:hypothetical protein